MDKRTYKYWQAGLACSAYCSIATRSGGLSESAPNFIMSNKSHRMIYRKCLDIITEYMKDHTQKEAIEHFGIYQSFIHRLQAKDYSRVSYQRAKQIVEENK